MALSRAQRRRINRQNARKSTGPRTDPGKSISRLNSLKHGLRIETLALPGEDAKELRELLDWWTDYYQPASPGEAELIEMAVVASIQRKRCVTLAAAAQADRIRTAAKRWDEARADEVQRLTALLETDPAAAVRLLRRTGHGCRWMITRWERLDAMLQANDPCAWTACDGAEAIRLQGFRPERDRRDEALAATLTHRVLVTLYPKLNDDLEGMDLRDALIRHYERKNQPPPPPECHPWTEDRERGLAWLRATIAAHLEVLRAEEARLREVYD